jgi:hypothetical protein
LLNKLQKYFFKNNLSGTSFAINAKAKILVVGAQLKRIEFAFSLPSR